MDKHTLNKIIGQNIKKARKECNFKNQLQLAEACGWVNSDNIPTQSRVSHYETGNREPNLSDLLTLAGVLGKDVSYFLTVNHDNGPLHTSIHPLINDLANLSHKKLILIMGKLGKRLPRKTSVDMIKVLLDNI